MKIRFLAFLAGILLVGAATANATTIKRSTSNYGALGSDLGSGALSPTSSIFMYSTYTCDKSGAPCPIIPTAGESSCAPMTSSPCCDPTSTSCGDLILQLPENVTIPTGQDAVVDLSGITAAGFIDCSGSLQEGWDTICGDMVGALPSGCSGLSVDSAAGTGTIPANCLVSGAVYFFDEVGGDPSQFSVQFESVATTPEPNSVFLLLLGLGSLCLFWKRLARA